MKHPESDFERRTQLLAHLLNDIIVGLLGILILMIAIASMLIWLSGHPEVSAFLPEWLNPNPAHIVTLPEAGE